MGLLVEAVNAGARLFRACEEVGIASSTYRRWQDEGGVLQDRRPNAERPTPGNKLTLEEREQLLSVFHEPAFKSLPPSQVVPALADSGIYLASESTCYRVLHEAGGGERAKDSSAQSLRNMRLRVRTRPGAGT